jgi:predicted amidophosphoribosyltransferase
VAEEEASFCSVCGQPARVGRRSPARPRCRNSWCDAPSRLVSAVYWVGRYQGALRNAIVAYKYGSDLRWAPAFGRLLARFLLGKATWFEEFGVVCPVPSFTGAGARRPWGHVELFCAELGQVAGAEWPVEELVVKTAETAPLSGRSRSERRGIALGPLASALAIAPGATVAGRRVVLVDDVCASGETLLAVAKVLRSAGAEEVAGLVLARASWRCPPP